MINAALLPPNAAEKASTSDTNKLPSLEKNLIFFFFVYIKLNIPIRASKVDIGHQQLVINYDARDTKQHPENPERETNKGVR